MTLRALGGLQTLTGSETGWASWKSYLFCCFSSARGSPKSTKYRSTDEREAPIGGPDTEDSEEEKSPIADSNDLLANKSLDRENSGKFDGTDKIRHSGQSDYGSGISCERDDDVIDGQQSRDGLDDRSQDNDSQDNASARQQSSEDKNFKPQEADSESIRSSRMSADARIADSKTDTGLGRCSISSTEEASGFRKNSLITSKDHTLSQTVLINSAGNDSDIEKSNKINLEQDSKLAAEPDASINMTVAEEENISVEGQGTERLLESSDQHKIRSNKPDLTGVQTEEVSKSRNCSIEEKNELNNSSLLLTQLSPQQRQLDTDEQLFDVSDLRDRDVISRCGRLRITLEYKSSKSRLSVVVHGAEELPSPERVGATNGFQVHLVIVPTKSARQKTKVKAGDSPDFDEKFQFKVNRDDMSRLGLRLRLYGCLRSRRREVLIGEIIVPLGGIVSDQPGVAQWLTLEPRNNLTGNDGSSERSSSIRSRSRGGSASSSVGGESTLEGVDAESAGADRETWGTGAAPELLLGIVYNSTTGRLTVEVIKGSGLQLPSMSRPPDTFVKLALMSRSRTEMARGRTSVRRHQPHPVFRETFMFQVAQSQLPNVSLHVTVCAKKSLKREEMLGWVTLGEVNSSEEEKSHWDDVVSGINVQSERWHQLLEP